MRIKGFSLIELVIVVVIVAILAAIALPSYRTYVLRSQRAVGASALADLAARQNGIRLQRHGYASTFEPLVNVAATTVYLEKDGSYSAKQTDRSIYQLDLIAAGIRAVPVGNQAKDPCTQLDIGFNGSRSAKADGKSAAEALALCWI